MQKIPQSDPKSFPFHIADTDGVDKNARVLHWHKDMEICRVKSGEGKYLINGIEYVFEKDDVFIINNDDIHLCYEDNNLIMQVIMFDPSIIWSGYNNAMDYEYLKPFMETDYNFSNKLDGKNGKIHFIISTLMEIEKEYKEMSDGYELMIKSLLLKLLTLIIRHFKTKDDEHRHENVSYEASRKIKQVIDYIHQHYTMQLKIDDMANLAQMSVPHFCNVFRMQVGVSPISYIINKRISSAKEALKNTDKKILHIAEECGFNSISNFNHLFKTYTGMSPRAYRES